MFETQAVTFHEVLEMIEMLPEEEQETLLDIIQHRLRERGRERIAQNVMRVRAEYTKGEVRRGTVEDLMREIDG
jgi:tRNA nucleotidyltransferase (CCA-adding enzyme)